MQTEGIKTLLGKWEQTRIYAYKDAAIYLHDFLTNRNPDLSAYLEESYKRAIRKANAEYARRRFIDAL